MWFLLSLLALTMLVTRRSSEKTVARNINSMAMAWLQQAVALPVIVLTLFFARFYWPAELPPEFWGTMAVFLFFITVYQYCYFKALSIADISYLAPMLSLVAVSNIIGAYFVLGQSPSAFGILGALLIICGAFLVHRGKKKDLEKLKDNRLALILILIGVSIVGYISNLEVHMLRASNPTSYNFYSSVLTVPIVLIMSSIIVRKRRAHYEDYWKELRVAVTKHFWPLAIVGVSYTINLLATYQAKLIAPNAGYVGAVKSAQVLPMVLVGVLFFGETIVRKQWYGVVLIVLGLAAMAMN